MNRLHEGRVRGNLVSGTIRYYSLFDHRPCPVVRGLFLLRREYDHHGGCRLLRHHKHNRRRRRRRRRRRSISHRQRHHDHDLDQDRDVVVDIILFRFRDLDSFRPRSFVRSP